MEIQIMYVREILNHEASLGEKTAGGVRYEPEIYLKFFVNQAQANSYIVRIHAPLITDIG